MSKRSKATRKGNSPNSVVAELKTLLVGYGRQEIVTPLAQLGKTLKLGVLGALSIGIGLIFLAVAGLRLLQTEASGVFDGNMSALPYLVVLVGLLVVLASVFALRSQSSRGDRS